MDPFDASTAGPSWWRVANIGRARVHSDCAARATAASASCSTSCLRARERAFLVGMANGDATRHNWNSRSASRCSRSTAFTNSDVRPSAVTKKGAEVRGEHAGRLERRRPEGPRHDEGLADASGVDRVRRASRPRGSRSRRSTQPSASPPTTSSGKCGADVDPLEHGHQHASAHTKRRSGTRKVRGQRRRRAAAATAE